MRIKFAFLLVFALAGFMTASLADAKVYFLEDFESFSDGDKIPGKSKVWVHNNPDAMLDATASKDKSYPPGGKSVRFDTSGQCIGLDFASFKLPEKYVLSCYYYHDSKEDPPPDMMICPLAPNDGPWVALGTRSEAEDKNNYTYRDKFGDGVYHDTKVPRFTDWVNFVWVVSKTKTELFVDGKKVYTSSGGTSVTIGEFYMGTMWEASPKSPVYVDYLAIADTLEEAQTKAAVKPYGKLASRWGSLKSVY